MTLELLGADAVGRSPGSPARSMRLRRRQLRRGGGPPDKPPPDKPPPDEPPAWYDKPPAWYDEQPPPRYDEPPPRYDEPPASYGPQESAEEEGGGVVDEDARAVLMEALAAVDRLVAESGRRGRRRARPAESDEGGDEGGDLEVLGAGPRDLKRGDGGDDVRDLQRRLVAAGFPVGEAGADGDFGAGTEAAVRAYQAGAGLPVTGVVDLRTDAALWVAAGAGDADAAARARAPAEVSATRRAAGVALPVLGGLGAGTIALALLWDRNRLLGGVLGAAAGVGGGLALRAAAAPRAGAAVVGGELKARTRPSLLRRLFGAKSETISNPTKVIVAVKGSPRSVVFATPAATPAGTDDVASVKTVGGERWVPAYSKTTHNYNNPRKVVVKANGAAMTFDDVRDVQVFGGVVFASDYEEVR